MKKLKIALVITVVLVILILASTILYKTYFDREAKKQYETKEEIIELLEKGLESSSKIKIFIFSRENVNDEYTKIINEGTYKELIGIVNLNNYKSAEYEFILLNETDNDVIGYFSKNDDKINGTTYITIDRKSGKLKSLDNNLIKVTIY